jgi:hypothetical protein
MAVKNCWVEVTMLPCVGREHYRLSVTDSCRRRGGDRDNMQHCIACLLVKIAHSRKFNKSGHRVVPLLSWGTECDRPAVKRIGPLPSRFRPQHAQTARGSCDEVRRGGVAQLVRARES